MIKEIEDREVWDEFVNSHDGHPLQLWGWGEAKAQHGAWTAYHLMVGDDGGAQVLVRRLPKPFGKMAYIPRGPILTERGSADEVLNEIAKWAKQQRCIELKVEPDWTTNQVKISGFKQSRNTILIPKTVMLDLSLGEEELLSNASKKTRQYIRKSAAAGVTVSEISQPDDLKKCLQIYKQTAQRADFALHDDDYYLDIAKFLGENCRVFVAKQGGEILSFLWLAVTPRVAFELYGGVNDSGQELRANYALKWETIRQMKADSVKFYDMNGLLNDGVSNFKLGFSGGEETELIGTIDKPLSPMYGLYEKALPSGKKIIRKFHI